MCVALMIIASSFIVYVFSVYKAENMCAKLKKQRDDLFEVLWCELMVEAKALLALEGLPMCVCCDHIFPFVSSCFLIKVLVLLIWCLQEAGRCPCYGWRSSYVRKR